MAITQRFYLDPFEVENQSFEHFCDIVNNLICHDKRNEKENKSGNTNSKIKRPANDNWF